LEISKNGKEVDVSGRPRSKVQRHFGSRDLGQTLRFSDPELEIESGIGVQSLGSPQASS